MSVKCAAASAAAHTALAALVDKCISAILFTTCTCFFLFAHAMLAADRLGGVDKAAKNMCITVLVSCSRA